MAVKGCYEGQCKFTQNSGKHPLRISTRRYGNIKMDLREVGCEDLGCMKLAHDHIQLRASVLVLLNLRVLSNIVSGTALKGYVQFVVYRIISAICSLVVGYRCFCGTCRIVYPDDGDFRSLCNDGNHLRDYTVPRP